MKRLLFLCLLILNCCMFAYAYTAFLHNVDLSNANLHGPVASIQWDRQFLTSPNSRETLQREPVFTITFDSHQNLLRFTDYLTGTINNQWICTNVYDDSGHLQKQTVSRTYSQGKKDTGYAMEYFYDVNERLIKGVANYLLDSTPVSETEFYEYDKQGHVVKVTSSTSITTYCYLRDGRSEQRNDYSDHTRNITLYNKQGKEIQYIQYKANGELDWKNYTRYNSHDDVNIKTEYHGGQLAARYQSKYIYDAYGNWIEKTWSSWDEATKTFNPVSIEYRTITYQTTATP